MKQVFIVVPTDGALMSSLVRLFKIFNKANERAFQRHMPLPFVIKVIAETTAVNLYGGRYAITPNLLFHDNFNPGLILIPAVAGNIAKVEKENDDLQKWVAQQCRGGAEIACLCTAAFLLPATGLLKNNSCRKEWFVSEDFRAQFSQVNLIVEKAVMDEGLIHTNGGAYSFINKLICAEAGIETATICASFFEKDFNQECQSVAFISPIEKMIKSARKKKMPVQSTEANTNSITRGQFAAMLNLNREDPSDNLLYDYIMDKIDNAPVAEDETNDHTNNSKIFKTILGSINKL